MAVSYRTEPSGWTGWILFAGIMMVLSGGFQAIAGLTALLKPEWYITTANALLVFDYNAWGWYDLIVGGIVILAGFALMSGASWARVVAVIMATLSAFIAMLSFNAYPFWSLIIIALDVIVIYAVTVYGGELRE